jgi:hypothetical protein
MRTVAIEFQKLVECGTFHLRNAFQQCHGTLKNALTGASGRGMSAKLVQPHGCV